MGLLAIVVSLVSAIAVMSVIDSKTEGYLDTRFYFRKNLTVGDTFAS